MVGNGLENFVGARSALVVELYAGHYTIYYISPRKSKCTDGLCMLRIDGPVLSKLDYQVLLPAIVVATSGRERWGSN